MYGIVLAAGAGRRLRPHTDGVPKALVPVNGDTTILDIALRNMAGVGIRDVAVVVGYAAEVVEGRRAALERRHGVRLELVGNDRASDWNNCYSLWLAREYFAAGAMLANGDTVHPQAVEEALLAQRGTGVLLAVDAVKPLAEEEMKVSVGAGGRLERITKGLDPASAYGEYIGVTLIEPAAASPLTDALEATWRRDAGLYYEDGYQELADRGGEVRTTAIGALDWVEVDDPRDLERAREIACRC
ncbi:MAG: NTP transferase domain-containing protein [Streptosporangiales bacterium]